MAVPRINAIPYPPRATPLIGRNGKVADAWLTYFTHLGTFIAELVQRGTREKQPLATSVHPGTLYYVVDEEITERSNGNEWENYSDVGGAEGAGLYDLDYLGDYDPTLTYMDGDIVVGPDGIAYLCTKDNVATPPEPWPGVGIATSVGPPGPKGDKGDPGEDGAGIVDASYWTATPHPALVNERAMNALANGYVKNNLGNPYTIPIIPIAEGGTAASDPTTARANLGVGTVGAANYNGNASHFLRGDAQWAVPPQPVGVPSGMIAIFATACPVGWTRITQWDGLFLRGGPSYTGAVGGAGSHTHGLGSMAAGWHGHTAGGLVMPAHNHGATASGGTDNQGDHAHWVSVNGTTGPDDGAHFVADSGSSGTTTKPHAHAVSIGAATDGAGVHSHNVTVNVQMEGAVAIQGGTDGAQPALVGAMDWASSYPPFVDVVYCVKD